MNDPTKLLEAVGVDWKRNADLCKWRVGDGTLKTERELLEGYYAYTPEQTTYTGPGIDTPELDAILWVEGQRWCRENWAQFEDMKDMLYVQMERDNDAPDVSLFEWLMAFCPNPGHALAIAVLDSIRDSCDTTTAPTEEA